MNEPYRCGGVTPPAVLHARQRRKDRADAAEYFRLTGFRLFERTELSIARERVGLPRTFAQSAPATARGLKLSHRDERVPQ